VAYDISGHPPATVERLRHYVSSGPASRSWWWTIIRIRARLVLAPVSRAPVAWSVSIVSYSAGRAPSSRFLVVCLPCPGELWRLHPPCTGDGHQGQ